MSSRELRALDLTISNTDSISSNGMIITCQRAKMGTEAEQLKTKLEELESELNQPKTQKDEEIQQLRGKAKEARTDLELEQKRSASLEEEFKPLRYWPNLTSAKLWIRSEKSIKDPS